MFPLQMFYFLNAMLLGALRLFYQQKIRFKEALLSALDDELKEQFIYTTSANIPNISLSVPWNLVSSFNLLLVLQDMHSANIRRGSTFIQVTFGVTLLQFAYICVQIIYLKATIDDLGGPVFLFYSFFDFFVIFFLIIASLSEGAVANRDDTFFKKLLMKLLSNITDTRELGVEGLYFELDGQVHIVRKQPDGSFLSETSGESFANLDNFENVNQDVLDAVDKLEEKIVAVIEQLDHKMEFYQFKFFGDEISSEMVGGYMSNLIGVLVMLSQEVLARMEQPSS